LRPRKLLDGQSFLIANEKEPRTREFFFVSGKRSDFAIFDSTLAESFWDYFRDEHHTFYDAAEGKRLMTTPWWTAK
jgi:hypothetical protein